MLQYPLLTESNYAAWSIKMRVNLQAQGVWHATEHGGKVGERKDKMTLATIYQLFLDDLLILTGKNSAKAAWEILQTMHMGVEWIKEVKVQTLKSEFEVICMKDGESIDNFAMKLMTIVTDICLLGDKVEEIFVVKKFLRAASETHVDHYLHWTGRPPQEHFG